MKILSEIAMMIATFFALLQLLDEVQGPGNCSGNWPINITGRVCSGFNAPPVFQPSIFAPSRRVVPPVHPEIRLLIGSEPDSNTN